MDIFVVGGVGSIAGRVRRIVPASRRNDATPDTMSASRMSGSSPVPDA